MKYVAAIVFAIFMMSATSTLFENPGFNIDETINGLFPKSFFIKGILKVNTEDIRDDIFRFDGNNNLLSISQTLYDTDFKMNLTFTLAFDFVNNMTYSHSTKYDNCIKDNEQMIFPNNIIDLIDSIWYNNARIVYDKWIDGHHFQSINVPYDSYYNLTFHSDNDNLYKINGTIGIELFDLSVTAGITPTNFEIRDHIPKSCLI